MQGHCGRAHCSRGVPALSVCLFIRYSLPIRFSDFLPFLWFYFFFWVCFSPSSYWFLWAFSLRDPPFIHFSRIMFVFLIELQCSVKRCYTTLHKARGRLENASGMLWAFVVLSLCKINFLLSFFPSGHSVLGSLEPFTSCSNHFSLQVRIIWACEIFSEEEKDEHSATECYRFGTAFTGTWLMCAFLSECCSWGERLFHLALLFLLGTPDSNLHPCFFDNISF